MSYPELKKFGEKISITHLIVYPICKMGVSLEKCRMAAMKGSVKFGFDIIHIFGYLIQ